MWMASSSGLTSWVLSLQSVCLLAFQSYKSPAKWLIKPWLYNQRASLVHSSQLLHTLTENISKSSLMVDLIISSHGFRRFRPLWWERHGDVYGNWTLSPHGDGPGSKESSGMRLGCKISRSALVAYFLRQGFRLPKLYHLFETECSNSGAYGKTFTFKLQVYNHHLNFLWNSDSIASMNSRF